MEFQAFIKQLGKKSATLKEQLQTEEAVKTAIILPFIQGLGYDIFDPSVVNPEFVADMGIKKGEKVDYAIIEDGTPIFIVECKHWKQKLTTHGSQLFRYFNVTPCKFAILTNGIDFHIYSDFDAPNIMDETPFFTFDITTITAEQLDFLEWFHLDYFEAPKVIDAGKRLKYISEFSTFVKRQLATPDDAFLRFIIGQVYKGKLTDKAWRELSPLVRESILKLK
jgi:predicted type IV restriction endonuclease